MKTLHKRILIRATGLFVIVVSFLWGISFWTPVAVEIPGYVTTLNVHGSSLNLLLYRGRFYSGLLGCWPYVWKSDQEVEILAYGKSISQVGVQKVYVVVLDRRTRARIVATPDYGYHFARRLNCRSLFGQYKVKRDGKSRLAVNYSEPQISATNTLVIEHQLNCNCVVENKSVGCADLRL